MSMQSGEILVKRFEIRQIIGEGKFGTVYLAYDRDFDRLVAIKELSSRSCRQGTTDFSAQRQKFEREARALSKFQHPNIVSVYQPLHEDDVDYLVLEYVDGGSLKGRIEAHQLSVEQSVKITVDICHAISAMAKHEIVHRDIKPGNVLLTQDGRAKLTDFGVAQLSGEQGQITNAHHPGTRMYMSPEQDTTSGSLDQRSDLYSLGLVLYEMITGQAYLKVENPLERLKSGVPRWLTTILIKALQVDRGKRFQTAEEMELALLHRRIESFPNTRRTQRRLVGLALLGAIVVVSGLMFAFIPWQDGAAGAAPTATLSGLVVPFKTATVTLTYTPTITLSPTETVIPTNTPIPTTATPTPTPTPTPTTRIVRIRTATATQAPPCPHNYFWDPVMNRCRNSGG